MNLKLLAIVVMVEIATHGFGAPKAQNSAESAVATWLTLVDAGNAQESWQEADNHFKSEISFDDWKSSLGAIRASLGSPVSRKMRSGTGRHTADSSGIALEFETVFPHSIQVVEVVTSKLDARGNWKISEYNIYCPIR